MESTPASRKVFFVDIVSKTVYTKATTIFDSEETEF